MILSGLAILVVTYVGTRNLKKFKTKNVKEISTQSNKEIQNEIKREVDTNLKISTASIALTTIGYFYAPILIYLGIATVSYAMIPILRNTEKNLLSKQRTINNNLLNSIVFILCIVTGHYIIASISTWFFHLADKMVIKIQDNTKKILTNTLVQPPQKVWILKDSIELEVPLESLQLNDIVVVNTGEIIAIDGLIIKGIAMIDQHTLTGESAPSEKGTGDKVFASTILVSGKIYIKVEKLGMDTSISQIGHILLHTADFKMTLQTKGEKLADNVATPLLVMGGLFAPFIGIMPAMTVLYSGPGNMVKTFFSLQLLTYITLLSKNGILVKDGRTLETLQKVDTVLFDKTGTLTKEHPEVGKIFTFGEVETNKILTYAAIAEQRLTHPIAHAIRQKAEEAGLLLSPIDLENAHYQIGYGITVLYESDTIHVGSVRFIKMQGIYIPEEIEDIKNTLQNKGSSLIVIGINNAVMGAIEIQFSIRPEAKETITALRQRGIKYIAIVSGDHKEPTKKLANSLKVDDYFYDVLPPDKANIVDQLQKQGKTVCFVGDGINDAIAIKKANVSISLNGATSVATDLAQVILMNDGLSGINYLFEISKELNKKSKQTLFICSTYGVTTFIAGTILHIGLIFPLTVGTANYMIGLAHAALPGNGATKPCRVGDNRPFH
jgi:heavy metal translocating P-type ATPase